MVSYLIAVHELAILLGFSYYAFRLWSATNKQIAIPAFIVSLYAFSITVSFLTR